ncbi:hypothetical protein [Actinomadura chokoriensis]|uniref:Uncharacterized protein n=1 Tax=Actinomadura chokoriensis TaxID=454156 RepID=A0ABV4QRF1_9ACTN
MIGYRAEVERILDGPPSRLAFRALCAALARAGGPQALVSFCAERLASWPDPVREAPWSWLAALDAGHSKPGWPLVRSLALGSARCGLRDAALPDPRRHPEVRGVTHLDLGWFADEQLTALVETMDQWDGLRSIQIGHLTDMEEELVAKLAAAPAVARLESLSLLSVHEDMWHFGKPSFRPATGRPWRLRHAGLRAPDLVHLMRSGLVPELRSAEVLVCDTGEAQELAGCEELARLDRLAIGFRCGTLPTEVVDQASFPSLDAMFLGIVDEYHGAGYSCGFPARTKADIASANTTRPELVAFLSHLDAEELDDSDEGDERADDDFRTERTERHAEYLAEARGFAHLMIDGNIGWPPAT